jgi:hypothetical protein
MLKFVIQAIPWDRQLNNFNMALYFWEPDPDAHNSLPTVASIPSRTNQIAYETADDQGIYMADLVADELADLHREVNITVCTADAEKLLNALIPEAQWVWKSNHRLYTGSLRHENNISRGTMPDHRNAAGQCPLCGLMATQAHINTTCSHLARSPTHSKAKH